MQGYNAKHSKLTAKRDAAKLRLSTAKDAAWQAWYKRELDEAQLELDTLEHHANQQ